MTFKCNLYYPRCFSRRSMSPINLILFILIRFFTLSFYIICVPYQTANNHFKSWCLVLKCLFQKIKVALCIFRCIVYFYYLYHSDEQYVFCESLRMIACRLFLMSTIFALEIDQTMMYLLFEWLPFSVLLKSKPLIVRIDFYSV